jgi:hypothetical protein
MLVDREKKWGSYKMEVVIRKGGRMLLLWKLIGKKIDIKIKLWIIRLENEVVISLEWSKDDHIIKMVM